MSKSRAVALALACGAVAALVLWARGWEQRKIATAEAASAPAEAPSPVFAPLEPEPAADPPELTDVAAGPEPATAEEDAGLLIYREPPQNVMDEFLSRPEVRARLEEMELQREAAERFSGAVGENEIRAEDMNRSVIAFFETMELEPVVEEGGMMRGLEIRAIHEGSPAHEAGFRVGDVVASINDVELRDPADLPPLLVRLERDLDVCVERDGARRCARIALD